jgi:hypothetical protein
MLIAFAVGMSIFAIIYYKIPFYLVLIPVAALTLLIFNRFIVGRIILNKKFWMAFLTFFPSIIITLIIAVPVTWFIFYISESTILSIIFLVLIIFLPF